MSSRSARKEASPKNELKLTTKTAKKELLPLQPGDVPDTYADVDDLVAQFDYKPSMSVKQGVENFSVWYKEYNRL